MAEKSTFIKLDRNITKWRWYQDGNTVRGFLHLLINANITPHGFESITVERGQVVSSYEKIGGTLKLTPKQVRTAISHLKSTGTVATRIYPKFQVFTIVNYDYYQSFRAPNESLKGQSEGSQRAPEGQQYNNIKNNKNEKNIYAPSSKENLLFEFFEGDDEI